MLVIFTSDFLKIPNGLSVGITVIVYHFDLNIGIESNFIPQVITGWGRHSATNNGQIKTVVEQHLKKHGFKYYCDAEKNPGLVNVILSCP